MSAISQAADQPLRIRVQALGRARKIATRSHTRRSHASVDERSFVRVFEFNS